MREVLAISAAIFSPNKDTVLAIRRKDHPADILAGLWGLPAVSLTTLETDPQGVARIGSQKLGTTIRPIAFIGQKSHPRSQNLLLTMRLWECSIEHDPDFSRRDMANPHVNQYADWQWMEPQTLIATAQKGSLCTQLLLEFQGIIYAHQS